MEPPPTIQNLFWLQEQSYFFRPYPYESIAGRHMKSIAQGFQKVLKTFRTFI